MLKYQYDKSILQIDERVNRNDFEFEIHILKDDPYLENLKHVRDYFEENRVLTDALFYANAGHVYKIIVRSDYRTEFILQLMKYKLLLRVEWS